MKTCFLLWFYYHFIRSLWLVCDPILYETSVDTCCCPSIHNFSNSTELNNIFSSWHLFIILSMLRVMLFLRFFFAHIFSQYCFAFLNFCNFSTRHFGTIGHFVQITPTAFIRLPHFHPTHPHTHSHTIP